MFSGYVYTTASTAEAIFEKMDSVMNSQSVPWINFVDVGVEGTSVNIGRHYSIMTRIQARYKPSNLFHECHIAHNAMLMGRLITVTSAASSVLEVDFLTNQKSDQNIFIGLLTKQTLENEGDCTLNQKKNFYTSVRSFYEAVGWRGL